MSEYPDTPTLAAGYIRVSTEEQAKRGWNLGADRKRIEATVAARGWELVAIYDDAARQGDHPDRPDFLRMLADAEASAFDVVIMRDLDRLGRKTMLSSLAFDTFQRRSIPIEEFYGDHGTGTRRLDLDNEDDRALAEIKAAFAQLEKAKLKGRVREAKLARAEAGMHPGGKRPYGYVLVGTGRIGKKGKEIFALVVEPSEAAVAVRMFRMALGGTSQRQIARILNDEGIPSSKGGRWAQSIVARVLGSPLYIGLIRRRRADGGWETFKSQHDATVDEDLWRDVNKSRAQPERRVGGRPMGSEQICTRGSLRCGRCGSAMQPIASRGGRPEVYKCLGRQRHGPGYCQQPSVRRDAIDDALTAELDKRYLDWGAARERLRKQRAAQLPGAKLVAAEAEREVAAAESRVAKVVRGWPNEVISDQEYASQRADLDDELAGAQEALRQARRRVSEIGAAGAATDAEEAILRQLAELRRLISGAVGQARDWRPCARSFGRCSSGSS